MKQAQQIKLRDQWRKLNLEINQIWNALNNNMKAGYKPSEEYMQWVNDKMKLRDELTLQID